MTSLDFLYIALGGGFLLLMIFLSVLILHVTILLRDVSKITEDIKNITGKVRETVFEPLKALSEMTAGFGFINDLIAKIKDKYAEHLGDVEDANIKEKPAKKSESKNKNGFFVKKLDK